MYRNCIVFARTCNPTRASHLKKLSHRFSTHSDGQQSNVQKLWLFAGASVAAALGYYGFQKLKNSNRILALQQRKVSWMNSVKSISLTFLESIDVLGWNRWQSCETYSSRKEIHQVCQCWVRWSDLLHASRFSGVCRWTGAKAQIEGGIDYKNEKKSGWNWLKYRFSIPRGRFWRIKKSANWRITRQILSMAQCCCSDPCETKVRFANFQWQKRAITSTFHFRHHQFHRIFVPVISPHE